MPKIPISPFFVLLPISNFSTGDDVDHKEKVQYFKLYNKGYDVNAVNVGDGQTCTIKLYKKVSKKLLFHLKI